MQDYSKEEGGAEQSNKLVVHVGESLGFDVVGMTPQSFVPELLLECDAVIVNNFWLFDAWQARTVQHALYEGRVPYVVYSHDYRDLTRPGLAGPLFAGAALNVFISPRHKSEYERALHVPRGVAVPLAIDVDGFVPQPGVARKPGTAVIVSPRKQGPDCKRYIQRQAGAVQFTALGRAMPECQHARPAQAFKNMPNIYSEFEHLVHLPRKEWAGERILFEAAMCGCKVVSNEKAGHMSWGWNLADRQFVADALERAPYQFWRHVEQATA